jgi:LysM repeat protein
MASERRRSIRRCPSCGSRLPADSRQCRICGAAVPWRLTVPGVALEGVLAVGVVMVLILAVAWWRGRVEGDEPVRVDRSVPRMEQPTSTPPVAPPVAQVETVAGADGSLDPAAGGGLEPAVATVPAEASATGDPPDVAAQPTGDAVPSDATAPPSALTAPPPGEPPPAAAVLQHTVVPGDTLGGIAADHGLSVDELIALNPGNLTGPNSLILVGDVLFVGAAATATAAPPAAAPAATGAPAAVGPEEADRVAPEDSAPTRYAAPLVASPRDGSTAVADSVLLQWASVGILPPGVYYVVTLRDGADPQDKPHLEWVTSNATALRVPASIRPALGTRRDIAWSVSIRRRAGRLVGGDDGVLLSESSPWHGFTWAPGEQEEPATP